MISLKLYAFGCSLFHSEMKECIFDVLTLTSSAASPTHREEGKIAVKALASHTFLHQSGTKAKCRTWGRRAFPLVSPLGEVMLEQGNKTASLLLQPLVERNVPETSSTRCPLGMLKSMTLRDSPHLTLPLPSNSLSPRLTPSQHRKLPRK